MKLEYKDGKLTGEKKPYDPVELHAELKKLGATTSTRIRTGGRIIIEVDKELTQEQQDTLKAYLDTIDINKTKVTEEIE